MRLHEQSHFNIKPLLQNCHILPPPLVVDVTVMDAKFS